MNTITTKTQNTFVCFILFTFDEIKQFMWRYPRCQVKMTKLVNKIGWKEEQKLGKTKKSKRKWSKECMWAPCKVESKEIGGGW